MVITKYDFDNKLNLKLALISDTHGPVTGSAAESLIKEKPDFILIPGDYFNRHELFDQNLHQTFVNNQIRNLKRINMIAPVIMSMGNHESHLTFDDKINISHSGTILLNNQFVITDDIAFGGLSSCITYDYIHKDKINYSYIDRDFIERFSKLDNYKILLSHHPEYYDLALKDKNIDLIVSGHAHGGQIRLFGQGLFAPGQGFFPKYTTGIHNNMIIGRGMKNTSPVPRLFNEPELVYINI